MKVEKVFDPNFMRPDLLDLVLDFLGSTIKLISDPYAQITAPPSNLDNKLSNLHEDACYTAKIARYKMSHFAYNWSTPSKQQIIEYIGLDAEVEKIFIKGYL